MVEPLLKKIRRKKMKRKNNNGIFYVVIALVAVLAVGSWAYAYSVAQNVNVTGDYNYYEAEGQPNGDVSFGASSGPDHYQHNRFYEGISVGGESYATSSTAATYTLTGTEFPANRKYSYVSWTANVNTTLSSVASTSAPFTDMKVGESFSQYWYNASTTAASTITFAAGTGVDLQEDEGETVVLNGLEVARVNYLKKADTDIIMWVELGQVGD